MKKIGLFLVCLLIITTIQAGNRGKTITNDTSVLPAASRDFIAKHFSGIRISHISIEKNMMGIKGYDVILTNGVDVEFDKAGEWTEVDANKAVVPSSIIPQPILTYVQTKFKEAHIIKIDKDWNDYEVDLSNGLELTFNHKGNLLDIDD
ncbi:hypothetical protein M2459_002183 [Parabacteroides sp. PF5-5]|uniref:PepSY-like domain-containing protein n=1 Tax=unclassified Parabacteroides TaxID=2649774 RepID=UPI002473FA33|nr:MULTISPECIES: PepSY-like domain-containing protein [unclassified Parabacteroides]MDH6305086.1 hypothetical protein [Parabacteroides sp. PH5-39]MDH6316436.1 hypothetical protein [Parabacteroides sp. PF5-13]MDH6319946.1 hypothetical protein [Parabacteroides sp. PH5-13]MDH6323821.1 hypothetical protein [Parabacteroides sp. PH5-8]MDH6327623.1 hypothetical protein [Parabacteroides sp. PH5-41]